MGEFQRIPSCPTCGKPLPCILHDRRTREALLAPEIEKPGFERMHGWTDAMSQGVCSMRRFGDALVLFTDGGEVFVKDLARKDAPAVEMDLYGTSWRVGDFDGAKDYFPFSPSRGLYLSETGESYVLDFDAAGQPSVAARFDLGGETDDVVWLNDHEALAYLRVDSDTIEYDKRDRIKRVDFSKTPPRIEVRRLIAGRQGSMLCLASGTVLVGGSEGIFAHDPVSRSTDRVLLSPRGIGGMVETKAGIFAMTDKGLFEILPTTKGNFRALRIAEMPESEFSHTDDDLHAASDMSLIALSASKAYRIDLSVDPPAIEELFEPDGYPLSLLAVSADRVLIGTQDSPLEEWALDNEKLRKYYEQKSVIPDEDIPELPEV